MAQNILKPILMGFFGIYLVILGILFFSGTIFTSNRQLPSDGQEYVEPYVEQDVKRSYTFDNPSLAFEVLRQFEDADYSDTNNGYKESNNFYLNLKNDENYCEKRRAHIILHPESIFEEVNSITDMNHKTMVRSRFLAVYGNDIQPDIGLHMPKSDILYDIDPAVNNYFSRYAIFTSKKIGKHFACLSQASNHIPATLKLDKKFLMTESIKEYAKKYDDRPQCFNLDRLMPKTYLLYRKDECESFFKVLNSPEYEAQKKNQTLVFLKKAGAGLHMGAGVDPVNEDEEANLKQVYDNGKKCGLISDSFLVQNYVPNPLLLHGRKFDFRSYMFIASTNPFIAYYHDGTLRVSLMPYDVASGDKRTLLTNIALNKGIYDDALNGNLFDGMNEDELKTAQQWTFSRFEDYLLETKVVSDRSWFDTHLRPQFKKAMVHLLRFGLVNPHRSSSVYTIYGLDFMLDTEFNLWFIEANSAPGMDRFSEPVEKFVIKMLRDENEIVMGLLKSRMKRVIQFVNELINNGSVTEKENGELSIANLGLNRVKFQRITENYFEDEFLPSPGNGFTKIIDENYDGVERYQGYLSAECL